MAEKYTKAQSLSWVTFAYAIVFAALIAYWYLVPFENMVLHSFLADVVATVIVFIFSRIFKNSSYYDAYWSVIPPAFLLYWWQTSGLQAFDTRYVLLSIVVWFWAIRLTFNWVKHWPGLHHEDWRYPMLRDRFPKFEFLIDFFAIHFYPTVQVFLGMLPMYACLHLASNEVGLLDYIACVLGVAAVTLQLVSDHQLHKFIATRKEGDVMNKGLWAYSRHPNYLGEMCFWLSLALFGYSAYPQGWQWMFLGFIAMVLMFMFASIPFMEQRSLERRPDYQKVIDSVSMLFPWPPKK